MSFKGKVAVLPCTGIGRVCLTRWVRTLTEHEAAIGELLEVARRASHRKR